MASVAETSLQCSDWARWRTDSPAAEQDLLSHIQNGYQLETDSLGGNPVLRRLKDNEEMRPLSANRNAVKAMEQRGLIIISPGKGRDALTIAWCLKKKIN